MKKIHDHLMKSNDLYRRWHENNISSALHWIILVAVTLLLTSAVSNKISEYAAENLAQVISQGDGLKGEYFNGKNFDTSVLTRTDPQISFDWGVGSPAPGVNVDNFSVRWTGYVE